MSSSSSSSSSPSAASPHSRERRTASKPHRYRDVDASRAASSSPSLSQTSINLGLHFSPPSPVVAPSSLLVDNGSSNALVPVDAPPSLGLDVAHDDSMMISSSSRDIAFVHRDAPSSSSSSVADPPRSSSVGPPVRKRTKHARRLDDARASSVPAPIDRMQDDEAAAASSSSSSAAPLSTINSKSNSEEEESARANRAKYDKGEQPSMDEPMSAHSHRADEIALPASAAAMTMHRTLTPSMSSSSSSLAAASSSSSSSSTHLDADPNETGAIGHEIFRQLCVLSLRYHFQNNMEGCTFDGWLTREPAAGTIVDLITQPGVFMQVKSTLASTTHWHSGHVAKPGHAGYNSYQRGAIVHVVIDVDVFNDAVKYIRAGQPIPSPMPIERLLLNDVSILPINRPADQQHWRLKATDPATSACAATMHPYLQQMYQSRATNVRYAERFSSANCIQVARADSTIDTVCTALDHVLTDTHGQFDHMPFLECEWRCAISHYIEHHGTKLMQVILNYLHIGPYLVARELAGFDAIIAGCSCEIKSLSATLGNVQSFRQKDYDNLSSGRVRCLIVHGFNLPKDDDRRFFIYFIPHTAFGVGEGKINVSNIDGASGGLNISAAALLPYRVDLRTPKVANDIRSLLAAAQHGDTRDIDHLINPSWRYLQSVSYLDRFVGLTYADELSSMSSSVTNAERFPVILDRAFDFLAERRLPSCTYTHAAVAWPASYVVVDDRGVTKPFDWPRMAPEESGALGLGPKARRLDGWPKNPNQNCPSTDRIVDHPLSAAKAVAHEHDKTIIAGTVAGQHRHKTHGGLAVCILRANVPGKGQQYQGQAWHQHVDGVYVRPG